MLKRRIVSSWATRGLAAVFTALLLSACANADRPALLPPADGSTAGSARHPDKGALVLSVRVPKQDRRGRRLHARYVSPATQSLIVALSGATTLHKIVGLTTGTNGGCTGPGGGPYTCNVTVPLGAGSYTGSIATYDGANGTGKELSADQTIAFSIVSGQKNTVGVTLDGVPASVAIVPGASATLSGNSVSGFTLSKCSTAAQPVTLNALDADGYTIVGPGAPASPALTSDDTAHLAVAARAPNASPNAFSLIPPATLTSGTLPSPGSVVHLTASVTPLADSGSAQAVSSKIDVTFNHDICGVATEFSAGITSDSYPYGITSGPDNNLWFTENNSSRVAKITTAGAVTEYSLGISSHAGIHFIASGSDDNLWFTETGVNRIGKITTSGTVTEYFAGITSNAYLLGITPGPDGNLWFTECNANHIGSITTSGTVTEYSTGISSGAGPDGITAGSDRNLWFSELEGSRIGKITTGGSVTEYSSGIPIHTFLGAMASGADGNLWFVGGGGIWKITTNGTATQYTSGFTGDPYQLAQGPDGNVWFTETVGNRIGRITTAGTVTEFNTGISSGANPLAITTGPDGNLWFTECAGNRIGRLQ